MDLSFLLLFNYLLGWKRVLLLGFGMLQLIGIELFDTIKEVYLFLLQFDSYE